MAGDNILGVALAAICRGYSILTARSPARDVITLAIPSLPERSRSVTVLTRRDLDRMQCATPGCTSSHGPLVMHGACHPAAATWAQYEAGELTVSCAQCKRMIAVVAIASGT